MEPETLDVAGYPSVPSPRSRMITELADRVIPEDIGARKLPLFRHLSSLAWALQRRKSRHRLFGTYDVILSAPGPFLAQYDGRRLCALIDLDLARSLGKPFLFSSHSVGPLEREHLGMIFMDCFACAPHPDPTRAARPGGSAATHRPGRGAPTGKDHAHR